MTFDEIEASADSSQPAELFRFDHILDTYAYTSHDVAHVFNTLSFEPLAISRTEIEQTNEDNSASVTITLPATNPVALLFRAYLPAQPVRVRVYRLQPEAEGDPVLLFAGTVTAAEYQDTGCTLTCQPAAAALLRSIPLQLYQKTCNHVLFSQSSETMTQQIGCNANRASFSDTVTVLGTSANTLTFASSGRPDGYFTGGYVELSTSERRWITSHASSTVELVRAFDGLAPGTQVLLVPGCDKGEKTCKEKFNNLDNYSGFTRLPTKNPFSSSLV